MKMNIIDRFAETAGRLGDKEAVRDEGGCYTYAQLLAAARTVATQVLAATDQQRVGLLAPTSEETGSVHLEEGVPRLIGASLLDEESNQLCTNGPWTWFTDSDDIVRVEQSENSCHIAAVTGVSQGRSFVNIEIQGFSESVLVDVEQATE